MKNKTVNTLAICALIIAVGGLTLGYAALNQVLNVNTSATVQNTSTSWSVKFENPSSATTKGSAESGTISLSTTDVTVSGVVLKAPADSVSYTFDVTNDGQVDAKLSQITVKNPTVTGTGDSATEDETIVKDAYTYTLEYADGTTPTSGDTLAVGATKTLKLTIALSESATTLPENDVTISGLGASLIYVQK